MIQPEREFRESAFILLLYTDCPGKNFTDHVTGSNMILMKVTSGNIA